MCRCLFRWRGRAALMMMLCAFAPAALAGPDDGVTKQEKKIPEIEEAGRLVTQGKIDDAYKLLQTIKEKQDLPPVRLMVARLMIASRIRELPPRIRPYLELAISENSDHPVCYLDNARYALEEGRVTDGILNCEKALAVAAANPTRWTPEQKKDTETTARSLLAQAYEARADWADARTQLNALLAKEKDPKLTGMVRVRLARATFFMDEKKADDAYQELVAASKDDKDKKLNPADVTMANFWAQKGDNPKAREWFEKAVKADPNNLRSHIAYADWLMQQNDINLAKLHVDAAAKIKADDPEVQKFQGLVLRINKQLPAAEQLFQQIVNNNADDVFARNHLALVLVDQDGESKHKAALQNADLNARANQKSPEALATLGYVLCKAGKIDEAVQMLQASLQASNGQASPDTAYYLALCLKDRDSDKAKTILKEALSPSAKGLFVYRQQAQDLYALLEKMPPKTATSSSK
jgi:tetratricopeptide (TPR) repeat protein